MQGQRILIVGAGIGGLGAATALAEAGHEVTVVELHEGLHSSVFGVGIIQAPNFLRALDVIDCARPCLEQGFAATYLHKLYDQAGNLTRTIPGPRVPGTDFPPMNGITRPRLHKILTDAALAAGARIEYSRTITELKQFGDRVEVGITDGSTRTVDLVVGADGVRSVVRRHVLDERWEPQYSGKSALRLNFPRLPEMDAIFRQEATTADGERIGVGLVPLAPDLGYIYVNVTWDRAVRPGPDELREIMREKLASFGGPAAKVRDTYIDAEEEIVLRPEEWLIAPAPWHRGRVVLIGDAVHSVTPNTAQGGAQAIEDGIVLTESLNEHASYEPALTAYADRRHDRCRLVVETGAKSRQWEFDPTPDFDPYAEGLRMRESLMQPI